MNYEDHIILQHYMKMTEFLGRVLGPDYEIVLHDLTDKNRSVIAIANNHISGRKLGAPLTNLALQIIADKSYQGSEYRLHYRGISVNGKMLRSSTMFIKNHENELIGLLCINFDDSRYTELSKHLMSLCHPDAFVETSFQYDEFFKQTPEPSLIQEDETFHSSTSEVAGEVIQHVLSDLSLNEVRMTQSEKLAVVEHLDAKGVFLLKGAVKDVAKTLGCSQASVYRYLSKIKADHN